MDRLYTNVINSHFAENRQMLFMTGPRQAGKTTTSRQLMTSHNRVHHLSWDNEPDRNSILTGTEHIVDKIGLAKLSEEKPTIIFDEIHKYPDWRLFLKGLYDTYPNAANILVTGSTRLDVYKKGGDSLMGRYFTLHHHPISVGETLRTSIPTKEFYSHPAEISEKNYHNLLTYGGYPDPYLKANKQFYNRWKNLRFQQLTNEDIRDVARVNEFRKLEVLTHIMQNQIGQLVSYSSFAKKVGADIKTIKNWINILESVYYSFSVRPWTENVSRSILKEPKYYLWDWSLCKTEGARAENFVASHLLKAIHLWNDLGFGNYQLYFLRDKEKREVDFLISKEEKPWILIEVKNGDNNHLSESLKYYSEKLKVEHTFQVSMTADYVEADCFALKKPVIVPAKTLLSQLV